MKQPQQPPRFAGLLTPERFQKISRFFGTGDFDADYLHWDDLRRRPAPDGLTHEDWWCLVKITRGANRSKIPGFADTKTNIPFQYAAPAVLLKNLHAIDVLSGVYIGTTGDNPIALEQHERRLVSSFLEEAIDSSRLEGASTTRHAAREMIKSGRRPNDRHERMILNNFITMRHVANQRNNPLTVEAIYEIHRLITKDTMDDPSASGRLRAADEHIFVADKLEGDVLHVPPPATELPAALDALCKFANQPAHYKNTFYHPVIRAVVLHFWLAWLHPFVDGNGRTARALFYWFMLRQGYWIFEYTSISSLLIKAPAQYAKAYLYTETDENDLTYFLLHQTGVMLQAVKNLHDFAKQKQREFTEATDKIKRLANYNHRQRDAILSAIKHPGCEITVAGYQQTHGVSRGTAWSDLTTLARDGLVIMFKSGRKKTFTPRRDLEQQLEKLTFEHG